MIKHSLIPFYISGETPVHRLHIGAKLFLLLVFAVLVFSTTSILALALYLVVFIAITLGFGLPVRSYGLLVVAIGLSLLAILTGISTIYVIALAVAKFAIMSILLGLFTMTTPYRSIIQLLSASTPFIKEINTIVYITNTTITVMPSIQYELQRAIDAETIRRNSPVRFYSFGSWITILTVLIARMMIRAERFTDAVLDRGYIPSQHLAVARPRPFALSDLLIVMTVTAGGLIIRMSA